MEQWESRLIKRERESYTWSANTAACAQSADGAAAILASEFHCRSVIVHVCDAVLTTLCHCP